VIYIRLSHILWQHPNLLPSIAPLLYFHFVSSLYPSFPIASHAATSAAMPKYVHSRPVAVWTAFMTAKPVTDFCTSKPKDNDHYPHDCFPFQYLARAMPNSQYFGSISMAVISSQPASSAPIASL